MVAPSRCFKPARVGHFEVTGGSFLPFLYRTRTIWRSYAKDNNPGARASTARTAATYYGSGKRSTNERARNDRSKHGNHSGRSSLLVQPDAEVPPRRGIDSGSARPKASIQVPHIPFEGSGMLRSPAERVEGSTMTPRELAIFERLFRRHTTEGMRIRRDGVSTSNVPARRGQTSQDFPGPLRALAEEANQSRDIWKDNSSRGSEHAAKAPLSEAAQSLLAESHRAMTACSTDAALWDVLHKLVFDKIKELKLDDASQDHGSILPRLDASGPHGLHILSQTLPTCLTQFMQLVQERFPGSPFGLSVLPTLRKLGPAAFTLCATTQLYNQHMRMLNKQFSDLDGIVSILEEMDREVYEYDAETRGILQTILRHRNAALNGSRGRAVQALWSTDRKTRALVRLERWLDIVDERVTAAALRRARSSAEEVGEDQHSSDMDQSGS